MRNLAAPTTNTTPKPPRLKTSVACLFAGDLPSWTVRRLEPLSFERPLIVLDGERVVGADRLARQANVTPGESKARALLLCPTATVRHHDPVQVKIAWESAFESAYEVTPFLEPVRPGLMFLKGANLDELNALVLELDLFAGDAPSHGTAQLAAMASKEGQVRSVVNENAFLAAAPTYLLKGMGVSDADTIARLRLFGVGHFGELYRFSKAQLEAQFGDQGAAMHALVRGQIRREIGMWSPPPCIEVFEAFDYSVAEPGELLPHLHRLLTRACEQLEGRYAWRIGAFIKHGGRRESRIGRVLRDGVRNPKPIWSVLQTLLFAIHDGSEVESIGVRLSQLERRAPQQDNLFACLERPHVRAAIEGVNGRFPNSLGRNELAAYAYLPQEQSRFVPFELDADGRLTTAKKALARGKR
jgi:nucleotidyltransferase/DNA polymerase involved in DNA repair